MIALRARICLAAAAASLGLAACGGSGTHSASTTTASHSARASTTSSTGAGGTTTSSTGADKARTLPIPTFRLPSKAAGCGGASSAGAGGKRIPVAVSRVGSNVGILVNVCVAGQGPFPFEVDTGSAGVTVDAGLADRLKLAPVGKPQTYRGAGCTGRETERRIGSWSVGGVPLAGQTVSAAKIPHLGGPGQPDGLIGSEVWSRFGAIRIDFRHQDIVVPAAEGRAPRKELLIKRPAHSRLPASLVRGTPSIVAPMQVDLAPDQTLILVKVSFGSHAANDFIPDTGASTSLVDSSVATSAGLKHVATRERQNTACSVVTLPEVASGPWSVAHHPLSSQPLLTNRILTSGPAAGLLGADQMSRFGSIVFDYHGGRLILGAG